VQNLFLDLNRINYSGHPHYSSLGNKILHFYFCVNYASKHNLNLKIPNNSNLDKIFDTNNLIENCENINLVFDEPNEFVSRNISMIYEYSKKQFLIEKDFLESKTEYNKNISVRGHFFHYELMPKKAILYDFIKLNKTNLNFASNILDDLNKNNENVVFVHYRGTDFENHENGLGDCRLKKEYYYNSFDYFVNNFNKSPLFVAVSDEPSFFEQFKNKYNLIILKNQPYEIDWILLHLCNNLISSNSSFCWTAALHNKNNLTQPKNGIIVDSQVNFRIPYGFNIKNSILI